MDRARIAIIGASGYVGAELVRLAAGHPRLEIHALGAERSAGRELADVFPAFRHLALPGIKAVSEIDFSEIFT